MSNNQPQNIPSAAEMLEMAKLQIVAEAFLEGPLKENGNRVPTPREKPYTRRDKELSKINEDLLTYGNDHTSKLTKAQAEQFMQDWEVISYMPITDTGFSGTLFRAKRPIKDDKGNVIVEKDQLIMSFRSTEFIDDSARDNQATNTLEIKEKGWAFGQIDDMERWYQSLRDDKTIGDGEEIILTGYSLGGHLATAFNILHKDEKRIKKTYTFNGAGVGKKADDSLMDKDTLQQIIKTFGENRRAETLESLLNVEARSYYQSLKKSYQELKDTIDHKNSKEDNNKVINIIKDKEDNFIKTANAFTNALSQAEAGDQQAENKEFIDDMNLLAEAITRARIVLEENKRVSELTSGEGSTPPLVNYRDIAAANFDYQVAVLLAARKTKAYSAWNVFNGESGANNLIFDERNVIKQPYEGFYDIYAKNPPSMVASSQLHYGTDIPITVENQPLGRGLYTAGVKEAKEQYGDLKLLVNNYNNTDFGDTHSIVLLVDSLETQRQLQGISNKTTIDDFNKIMSLSTNKNAVMDKKLTALDGYQTLAESIAEYKYGNVIRKISNPNETIKKESSIALKGLLEATSRGLADGIFFDS